jgi:type IVB pilus formation R64 PilN family outer membrane protein
MLAKFILRSVISMLLIGSVLSGCASNTATYNARRSTIAMIKQRADRMAQKQVQDVKPTKSVETKKALYVDTTPINLTKHPAWLDRRITLHASQMPFSFFANEVIKGSAVNVHFQNETDATAITSLSYTGTVKGALEKLAAMSGYNYRVKGNKLTWNRYVTRTFNVAFLPGGLNYTIGGKSGGSSSSGSSGGSGGQTSTLLEGQSGQFSNIKSKSISLWKDIEKAVKAIISKKTGQVSVSVASATITVTDTPQNVARVAEYIATINHEMLKEVLVKVSIITVELTDQSSSGIDWTVVRSAFGATDGFSFSGAWGNPLTLDSTADVAVTGLSLQRTIWAGTKLLLKALNKQGHASLVTEPSIVTMNNQVAVVKIQEQKGYLAKVTNTSFADTTGGGGGNSVSSQITPGKVLTGLTLFVLPRVIGKRIYLQVSSNISQLLKITKISVKDGGDSIQVPDLNSKKFNERALIKSGSTLILAGYRSVKNETSGIGLTPSHFLGGTGSRKTLSETIILITPMLMNG